MKEIFNNDAIIDGITDRFREVCEAREALLEYILRNKIDRPIKGNITKGKLRWRGIKCLVWDYEGNLVGVEQRGKIITWE